MYVRMYVRTYVCMYVCMYVCVYIVTSFHASQLITFPWPMKWPKIRPRKIGQPCVFYLDMVAEPAKELAPAPRRLLTPCCLVALALFWTTSGLRVELQDNIIDLPEDANFDSVPRG